MVHLCSLAFLCFITLFCLSSVTAEKKLMCSSEYVDIWYTFDGPLYYLSMTGAPCHLGVNLYTVTYTVIPMFTISRCGYHGVVYYKDQLWLDHVQPDVACEDIKFCYIIKGETLHDTVPFYVKKFFGPEGGRERGDRSPKPGERHPADDVSTTSPPSRCTTFTSFHSVGGRTIIKGYRTAKTQVRHLNTFQQYMLPCRLQFLYRLDSEMMSDTDLLKDE
ncbi:uncharacterized protein LOC127180157 [Labeo rohita]|uniref:uncharacterized protein LOC127180157 n=1 Tax=Labeo rohita TaxID=84645 RepID=UPI0021E1F340|nr:uncharacterized protein LOC127180157 [Labeo rohita]